MKSMESCPVYLWISSPLIYKVSNLELRKHWDAVLFKGLKVFEKNRSVFFIIVIQLVAICHP